MFPSHRLATGVVPLTINIIIKDASNKILNNKPFSGEALNKELFHKK